MTTTHIALRAFVAAGTLIAALPVHADSRDDEIKALRDQIQSLDQKLRVIERKQELSEEDSSAAAKTAGKVTLNDKGFTLASGDTANSIRLRGLVQLDHRLFLNDDPSLANTGFVLRRARIIAEGTFAKNYTFQLVPEFGGTGAVSILDANLGININKALQLKIGKFKVPVGLELLQSDSWAFFAERSLVTNLVPNRDLGIQASGDVLDGVLNYTVGVFNGVADSGSSTNADVDNDKDVAARLWYTPFKNEGGSPLQGLGFGVGGSIGRQKAFNSTTYRTDGQQTFFRYTAGVADGGQVWRVSPQLDYRTGPLGVQAEYAVSANNFRAAANAPKIEHQNKAWQVSAGYVLTGEDSSYNGVVPKTNFDPAAGTWGAFEVTARYSTLSVDDDAYSGFASANVWGADQANAWALGANWYLSKAVRFTLDYFQTSFDFTSTAGPVAAQNAVLRNDEKALVTRFQVSF
jgi:phosphate-selective porin OprO/OprP